MGQLNLTAHLQDQGSFYGFCQFDMFTKSSEQVYAGKPSEGENMQEEMMESRKKETLLWPKLWFELMNEVSGFARDGKLHSARMVRQVRSSIAVAVIATFLLSFVASSWATPTRVVVVIATWIIGMPLRRWMFNRVISWKTWIGEITQALLFGLFWGSIFSFLVSLLKWYLSYFN